MKEDKVEDILKKIEKKVKAHGPVKDKWSLGESHHPLSELLVRTMAIIGWDKFSHFDIRCGGDGDEGETMMFILDSYFEEFNGVDDVKKVLALMEQVK